jgi:hypothetical protein
MSPVELPAAIALLPWDNQHLIKSWQLVGLCSGGPEIAYILLRQSFQPHTKHPPLQHKSYKSFICVTDVFHLPTGYIHWPSLTSTFSVLAKYPSSGIIAWVHHTVL